MSSDGVASSEGGDIPQKGWGLQEGSARICLGGKKGAFRRWKQQKPAYAIRTDMKDAMVGNDDRISAPKPPRAQEQEGKR